MKFGESKLFEMEEKKISMLRLMIKIKIKMNVILTTDENQKKKKEKKETIVKNNKKKYHQNKL